MRIGKVLPVLKRGLLAGACAAIALAAHADPIPAGWAAENMEVVGYTIMNGHPAFKITMTKAGDRSYFVVGHYNISGWSVVDVTNPADPKVAKFIPGPANTSTNQVDLADNILVAALGRPTERLDVGMDPARPYEAGVVLIDMKDPLNPKELGRWHTDKPEGRGTHRNAYQGGRYVHLAADMKGYVGDIYVILDISNPAKPVEAGRWWVPGQHEAGGEKPQRNPIVNLHNPNFVDGNLVYLSYGDAGMVVLDISNVAHPKLVSQLRFQPPHMFGVHTVSPDFKRKLVYVNSEAVVADCKGPLDHATVVDVSDPAKPFPVSRFPVPVPAAGLPYANFCDKGGRFGPHATNEEFGPPFYQKLVFTSQFNAGVRATDIRDPYNPKEVASFIPAINANTDLRCAPFRGDPNVCVQAVQTNNVATDDRGFVYIVDRADSGMHVLRLTGEAARIAGLSGDDD